MTPTFDPLIWFAAGVLGLALFMAVLGIHGSYIAVRNDLRRLDIRSGTAVIALLVMISGWVGWSFETSRIGLLISYERWARQELAKAGINSRLLSSWDFVTAHVVLIVLAIFLPFLTTRFLLGESLQDSVMLAALSSAVAAFLPYAILKRRAKERMWRIFTAMPYFTDLLAVLVEAGLEFRPALERVIETMETSPLRSELEAVLTQLNVNVARKRALEDLSQRVPLREMKSFCLALIRQEELGTPVSEVLRQLSDMMREARLRSAEEKANKAPVQILLPLVLFIFPSIFILLIGPLIIRSFMQVR